MMSCRRLVPSAVSTGLAVVRRKRQTAEGLPIPRHLLPDAVWPDPLRWRRERFEWGSRHDWPPGMIGYLDYFRETRATYRNALNLK
jgi:hypothetical protein